MRGSLVKQIIIGMLLGGVLAWLSPELGTQVGFLGDLFVSALKSVAPVLVFILVMSAVAGHTQGQKTGMSRVVALYFTATFAAALLAVVASFLFQVQIPLSLTEDVAQAPRSVLEVLYTLILGVVDNPVSALARANYLAILAWAILLGVSLRAAAPTTKQALVDLSAAVSFVVRVVIRLAPIGIFGIVADTVASQGLAGLAPYAQVLGLLLACMVIAALVVNPIIVYSQIKRNPYPLVFTCLRESGITAFFTRSSAANIPVNLALAKKLKLNEDMYSISIPLGATINMGGAAITISVLTLSAVHTLGLDVSFGSALLLCFVAAVCACGASGVAGGSLLLIPLACSLFQIPNEIAAQVVAAGLLISVLQDSAETALNSSTDVLFTAATSERL